MAMIRVCDVCQGNNDVEHYFFETDRIMSPAGDMEPDGKGFDLCLSCCGRLFRRAVKSRAFRAHEIGRFLVAEVRNLQEEPERP